jgi:hypothetical protein
MHTGQPQSRWLEKFGFNLMSWRGRSALRPYEKPGFVGAQGLAPSEAHLQTRLDFAVALEMPIDRGEAESVSDFLENHLRHEIHGVTGNKMERDAFPFFGQSAGFVPVQMPEDHGVRLGGLEQFGEA